MGLGWLEVDDVRPKAVVIVMTIVAIVIKVLDTDDIVVAMMGITVQSFLVPLVAMRFEIRMIAVVARWNMRPLRRSRRQLYHSWVMESWKLWVLNRIMDSSLFYLSLSMAVPHLLLCELSGPW